LKKVKTAHIFGAIAGDIIGSVYERHNVKRTDFELFTERSTFTDDSVMTLATMDVLLDRDGEGRIGNALGDYTEAYRRYGRAYPHRGYGGSFASWLHSDCPVPYNSWGNGSAMRVSPVGWAFDTIEATLAEAKRSAEVTHNHSEGIKGAQALAAAVYLARTGASKTDIAGYIEGYFNYDLHRTIDAIRPRYAFDVSCQGSVPEAIIAFLESDDYENAVRLAVSLGGDSDTIAAIAGSIAEAFYGGVPESIAQKVAAMLPPKLLQVTADFAARYGW
jgi:ADP-ribosylglycohydrolase